MKALNLLPLLAFIASCALSKKSIPSSNKMEIIRTDTIRDHFVFTTKDVFNNEVIILAEINKVEACRPFMKKFIIADSVHQATAIKFGSRYDMIGFNVSFIDGIRIKKDNELAKYYLELQLFL